MALHRLAPLALVVALAVPAAALAVPAPCASAGPVRCHVWSADAGQSGAAEVAADVVATATTTVVAGSATASGVTRAAVMGLDTATGTSRWAAAAPSGSGHSAARSAALSPDGTRVFVTGFAGGDKAAPTDADVRTAAYDTATGALLWESGPALPGLQTGAAVAADASGVYVAATDRGDYLVLALDPATGAQRWLARYDGGGADAAVDVDARGGLVFTTGTSAGAADADVATVAHDAATGGQVWLAREAAGGQAEAAQIVATADGTVVVAGTDKLVFNPQGALVGGLMVTDLYVAATGARKHRMTFGGGAVIARTAAVAVSPDGRRAFVTGLHRHVPAPPQPDAGPLAKKWSTVVAYDLRNGVQQWIWENLAAPFDDDVLAAVVPTDGSQVVVSGPYSHADGSRAQGVFGLDPLNGAQRWAAVHQELPPSVSALSDRFALAAVPGSTRVVAAGTVLPVGGSSDMRVFALDR